MGPYVVDSNFFIQAYRSYYPLDIAESFWNKVKQLANEDKIISIDKVRNEIYANNDDLTLWCKSNLSNTFFKDTTQVLNTYGRIVNWAYLMNGHYLQKAIDEFLDVDEADAWLIAFTLANNLTIVTYEVSSPLGRNKIKIPDVCMNFNVPYVNTIKMFRELGERF